MWKILPTVQEVDSTNSFLKLNASTLEHLTVIRADYQTAGRGQFDRTWESQPGQNLLMSFILKEQPIDCIHQIREWIQISVQRFLSNYHLNGVFKEPNDVLVNGLKILGILIETRQTGRHLEWVIIGIGVNINQIHFQTPQATSLRLLTKSIHSIEQCFHELLDVLTMENPL